MQKDEASNANGADVPSNALFSGDRQTGRTTEQMKNTARNGVFVWCNSYLQYPRSIAKKIGREDLEIVPQLWLAGDSWHGRRLTALTVDHACRLTFKQRQAVSVISAYIENTGVQTGGTL